MNSYHHALQLAAPPAAVYQALTTQEGLRGWWTQTCEIASQLGGQSVFRFSRVYKVMALERLAPEREVHWLCVEAHLPASGLSRHDEWVGTRLLFTLTPDGAGGTVLEFQHRGLTPQLQCYEMCREGWNHYLASLQGWVERGQGRPFVAPVQSALA